VLPWKVVPGYDSLVRQLINTFGLGESDVDIARDERDGGVRKPGASLVLFPYDFRLGVAAAAERLAGEVRRCLEDLTDDARAQRVIIIGHSMGGLVARFWLGPLNGASCCKALITLGTPHRGVPKALDWLLNGIRIGPGPVRVVTSHLLADAASVIREWPSSYDLLPRYQAVRDEKTSIDYYPHELSAVADQAFVKRAGAAFAMHREIETVWDSIEPTRRPEVLALFARGHATPSRSVVRDGQVWVSKIDAEWQPNPGWRGDGTVPAHSAIPIELTKKVLARRAVPERHVPMATSAAVVEVLRDYEGEDFASLRGYVPARPWLGLDIEEITTAGTPFPVTAELLGTDDVTGAVAWVRVEPNGEGGDVLARRPLQMTGEAGRWTATLPGLAPGTYRITVEAVNVPAVDRIVTGDVIGVIEP
jgi:pimeloyl-ACP methyl ester carboxylesterase